MSYLIESMLVAFMIIMDDYLFKVKGGYCVFEVSNLDIGFFVCVVRLLEN